MNFDERAKDLELILRTDVGNSPRKLLIQALRQAYNDGVEAASLVIYDDVRLAGEPADAVKIQASRSISRIRGLMKETK